MSIKWIGAILIVLGCGGFGFTLVMNHRKEQKCLQQMIGALDYMQCELQYRLTPLPNLCRQAAAQSTGPVRELFQKLAGELDNQICPDVCHCMNAALTQIPTLPGITLEAARSLGNTLGRFDVEGQLRGLESVRQSCRRSMEKLVDNADVRLRGYQTLGLCAGAALAILFI